MQQNKLARRDFMRLSALAAAGAVAVACQPQTVIVKETVEVAKEVTKVVEKTVEVATVSDRQSPMFQDLVKTGKLPPLEDRMPVSPKVARAGVELPKASIDLEIGQYGGTMRTLQPNPNSNSLLFISNNEPLINAPGVGVEEPGIFWARGG